MCIMLSYFYLQERRGKIADLWLAMRWGVFFALSHLKVAMIYFSNAEKAPLSVICALAEIYDLRIMWMDSRLHGNDGFLRIL